MKQKFLKMIRDNKIPAGGLISFYLISKFTNDYNAPYKKAAEAFKRITDELLKDGIIERYGELEFKLTQKGEDTIYPPIE